MLSSVQNSTDIVKILKKGFTDWNDYICIKAMHKNGWRRSSKLLESKKDSMESKTIKFSSLLKIQWFFFINLNAFEKMNEAENIEAYSKTDSFLGNPILHYRLSSWNNELIVGTFGKTWNFVEEKKLDTLNGKVILLYNFP